MLVGAFCCLWTEQYLRYHTHIDVHTWLWQHSPHRSVLLALWHYFIFVLSIHSFKQGWPNILEVSGLGWPSLSKFKAHACVFPPSRLAARRGNIERRKCWLRGKESVRLITKTGHGRQPRKQQKLDGVSSQFSRLRRGPCICNAAGWNQVHIAVLSSCVSPFVPVFFSAL